jgi:hypothetical protein
MLRYHIPLIGPWLYRRDMRRLGRELVEAFRRGLDEASGAVARELAALDKAVAEGKQFDGLLAVLNGEDGGKLG